MLRAPRPEIGSESTFTGAAGCGVCAVAVPAIATAAAYVAQRPTDRFVIGQFPSREGGLTGGVTGGVTPTAGFSKRGSSIATFASIFSILIFFPPVLPFNPPSIPYATYPPATSLSSPPDS